MAGAALLLVPIIQVMRTGAESGLRLTWLYFGLMGLIILSMAVLDLIGPGRNAEENVGRIRLELLLLGGSLGLATTLFGFLLPITTYREKLAAGLDSWRENPSALLWPGFAVLGGLGLTFASVQLVRGMERQSQTIRRIYYGFNVALTSLLLIAVLALPNILAYAEPFNRFFGRPFDWTESDINSVSPLMRNYLADLRDPVKIYMMLPRNSPITMDMQTLLDNCKSLSNRFSYEVVSPRSLENRDRLMGLMEKYSISDPLGLLVLVGAEEENTKPDFTFVKASELYEEESPMGRAPRSAPSYGFKGENALYNALANLTEGKLIIYFTTGHEELTPEGPSGRMPPGMPRPKTGGLSKLRERLTERKSVEVRTLPLDRSTKKIPDDAGLVVIARPTQAFLPEEVKVLREYLQRSSQADPVKEPTAKEKKEEKATAGKLMVLLDPVLQRTGSGMTMVPTGLETLMSEYGVQVGNNRLLTVARGLPTPTQVVAFADGDSPNPVAKAFRPDPTSSTVFRFDNVRTVEAAELKGDKKVDPLLISSARFGLVIDSKFDVSPTDLVEGLRMDEDRLDKVISRKNQSIAVAVSEGGTPPGMPRDAAHSSQLKETPRMVVFG
ncbi:MAG: Gldg family protein, partial [Gemmataceae bacterium]